MMGGPVIRVVLGSLDQKGKDTLLRRGSGGGGGGGCGAGGGGVVGGCGVCSEGILSYDPCFYALASHAVRRTNRAHQARH